MANLTETYTTTFNGETYEILCTPDGNDIDFVVVDGFEADPMGLTEAEFTHCIETIVAGRAAKK